MYHKILVPLDGSSTAERGLREAIALAVELKSKLHLLNVVNDAALLLEMASAIDYERTMNQLRQRGNDILVAAQRASTEAGVKEVDVSCRDVVQSAVADVILEEVTKSDCDLIVMGTHGRRGLSRLTMGSTAELVLRESPVPVMLVRKERAKTSDQS